MKTFLVIDDPWQDRDVYLHAAEGDLLSQFIRDKNTVSLIVTSKLSPEDENAQIKNTSLQAA